MNPSDSVHGGPDAQGVAPHDFSTNGNACGPCGHTQQTLARTDATHYPDPRYTALRAQLAQFHGVVPERIVIATSASEFIFRITAAVAQRGGRSAALPRHGYGDYAKAANAWGLATDTSGPAALVWCCDPSSPLGQPEAGLAGRIDGLHADAACVLDLAYAPLRLDGALVLDAAQRDRVWQLWTPNKALGLTGVRAAYAIAPVAAADSVRAALGASMAALAPSWPVGAHGVALLESWVSQATQQWLAGSLAVLRQWKALQVALCESLGWEVLPSCANFFCVRPRVPYDAIPALAAALRSWGIKVRDTASFGLPGHLRLAVLPPASQAALADAVQSSPGSSPG